MKSKSKIYLGILFLIVIVIFGFIYFSDNKVVNSVADDVRFGGFCGTSSYGYCDNNSDCYTSGCSGEICLSSNSDPGVESGCEYKDCYDESRYDLSCGCVKNKCRWHK